MNIDLLQFGNPTMEQSDILKSDSFLDEMFAELTSFSFPANGTEATQMELNGLIDRISTLRFDDEILARYSAYDVNVIHFIKKFLVAKNDEKTRQLIDSIVVDIDPLIYKLKFFFNRPRPKQLATYYKLKLFPFRSFSSDSPSFPSAHAFYAKVICEVLSNRFPDRSSIYDSTINDICYSRTYLGLNYQSDIDVGIYVAERTLQFHQFKLKYRL